MNNVSVKSALQKGQRMVNYPLFPIIIGGGCFTFYLGLIKINSTLVSLSGVLTFVSMWLWWSVQVVRWKIWAYENVRNVHELKRKAIEQKLIWSDNSWFNKTEIKNAKQRKRLMELEKKFEIKDEPQVIKDNGSVPSVTYIKYSYVIKWINISIIVILSVATIYCYQEKEVLLTLACLGGSLYTLLFALPKYLKNITQITLSNKGIQILDKDIITWELLGNFEIVLVTHSKSSTWYLKLSFQKENSDSYYNDEIEITNFYPDPDKLETLIKIYRQRARIKSSVTELKH